MQQFFIEMERFGPNGTVLVTLQDGPHPKKGDLLRDEGGGTWVVIKLRATEVELRPSSASGAVPTGRALLQVNAAHAAA